METGETKADPTFTAKADLRRRGRRTRAALGAVQRELASRRICEHILDSELYRRAECLAAYLAFGHEVDLELLIAESFAQPLEKRLALPRIVLGGERRLTLHLASAEDLEPHPYGPRQPTVTSPLVEPREIDLVLVPGLAFDRRGGRLGYGHGYYDRLLTHLPALTPRVGVSFDALVVESVPVADHDVRLTHLVTESGLVAVGS